MMTKPKYEWTPSASSFAGPQIRPIKNNQKSDGMISDAFIILALMAHKK